MTTTLHDDIYSDEVFHDPYAYYGMLREHDPVHWNEPYQMWIVTRYEDVVWLVRHPEILSSENVKRDTRPPQPPIDPAHTEDFHFVREFRTHEFIQRDPPEHTRMRSAINKPFTPKSVEEWRLFVRNAVNDLLDKAEPLGKMDIQKHLAMPLPLLVISEMLGIPDGDRVLVKEQADRRMTSALSMSPDRMLVGAEGIRESNAYLTTQVEERLAHPRNDLMGVFAEAEKRGQYSRPEVLANAQSLIDAGHETTIQLICNGTLAFLRNPAQWSRFKSDPDGLAVQATEECLRYDPPLPGQNRMAARDFTLHGKPIKAGQRVYYSIAAANRDPRAFPNPDAFNIARSPNHHVSFGSGVHYCLGQYLARLEGQEIFKSLAKRFPSLRLATDKIEYAPIRGVRNVTSLPVAWN